MAVGGSSIAGIRSRRKAAASRRNLKKALHVRQLNRLRIAEEAAFTNLQHYRKMERDKLEAAMDRDRAWIEERKDVILADPVLRSMYELLPSKSSLQAPS